MRLCAAAAAAGAVLAAVAAAPLPNAHACLPPYDSFPFCDTSLTVQERVDWLVANLTLDEKVSLMQDGQPSIDRLGIPFWNWNLEGLHGLGSTCLEGRCPTIFPAPPTLGAAFNTSLMAAMGLAISDEVRAMNNNNGTRQYDNRPVDPTLWLPSINLNVNVQWGRNTEVFSEDPLLAGRLAAHLVRAVQWGGGSAGEGYLKVIGATKHFSFYQVETNRFAFNAVVAPHDALTYLLSWQVLAAEGGNAGAMCAYPAVNGVPMCANAALETGLLKQTYGMGIGNGSYVQGDCGAIEFIADQHGYAANFSQAAAMALNAGTDIDCGSIYPQYLPDAIASGMTTEAALDASLRRTFYLQFLTGRFDPLAGQPYSRIPLEELGSPAHAALSFDAALQGMVLLRNDAGVLPLPTGKRIAVIGPHGNTTGDLAGTYFEWLCPGGQDDTSCVPSIYDAVTVANGGSVSYIEGCDMVDPGVTDIPAAVAAAQAADIVLLALGINGEVCGEGVDRANISLPGAQSQLAQAVLAVGKPTAVVLITGAQLGIDEIVSAPGPVAIVNAGAPGNQGGLPIAHQLFGRSNRWGKLPYTMYYANISEILDPFSYSMTDAPGRTYKYYTGPALYPFGWGLSYTTFNLSQPQVQTASESGEERGAASAATGRGKKGHARSGYKHGLRAAQSPAAITSPTASLAVSVQVSNTGAVTGDEVVLCIVKPQAASVAANVPGGNDTLAKQILADFTRVTLSPGQNTVVTFNLTAAALGLGSIGGDVVLADGWYDVVLSNGAMEVAVPVQVALSAAALRGGAENGVRSVGDTVMGAGNAVEAGALQRQQQDGRYVVLHPYPLPRPEA